MVTLFRGQWCTLLWLMIIGWSMVERLYSSCDASRMWLKILAGCFSTYRHIQYGQQYIFFFCHWIISAWNQNFDRHSVFCLLMQVRWQVCSWPTKCMMAFITVEIKLYYLNLSMNLDSAIMSNSKATILSCITGTTSFCLIKYTVWNWNITT